MRKASRVPSGHLVLATAALFSGPLLLMAQQGPVVLPQIQVDAPSSHAPPVKRRTRSRQSASTMVRRSSPSRTASAPPGGARAAAAAAPAGGAPPEGANVFGTQLPDQPLAQTATLSKTGTKVEDIPTTVQVLPRALLNEQGDTSLRQTIVNASGVTEGGQDTLGYFDHFLIRGLNAQIYEDGFSDGDQLGGVPHSLNGVQRVEILEGPGSALFGSGPPGGTINIVHYKPLTAFHWGASVMAGSFGTVTTQNFVTGPATIPGLSYRVDATLSRADGFRDLRSTDAEIRPDFLWTVNSHTFELSVDARSLHQTPDSYGILYFQGAPIRSVPIDAKYSTPFSSADQTFVRPVIADQWYVNDLLTINNRLAYTNRSLAAERNGDSTRTTVCLGGGQKDPVTNLPCTLNQVVGRQLRQQDDRDDTIDYQVEPIWRFGTGPVRHTLLTGFEAERQMLSTERTTADLPNIANAFAPVPPEMSTNGLVFKCDASHSCDNDRLSATFLSFYATDQMDIGDNLRLRAGARQDLWDTTLDPLITVPGRFANSGQPIVAGQPLMRDDAPVSWNVGALYHILPGISPYVGVSRSYLTNFNSENTQNGIGAPESALQYEAGVKVSLGQDRIAVTTAVFDVARDNVATPVTLNGVEQVVFDSQRTRGVEATLDARITDRWRLLANATAQNAVITDNPQAAASVGNHPQGVPAYMVNVWSTYQFSVMGISGFQVGAGLNYRDKTYSDVTNLNAVPSYLIVNAALIYETKNWGASLNIKNLTDQRYYIAANAAGALVGDGVGVFIAMHINM